MKIEDFDPTQHVNRGWAPLVATLVESIAALRPEKFSIDQVKEKFGGLRFYFSASAEHFDEITNMVAVAEAESMRICEVCGEPGELRTERRWMLTLCAEHNMLEQVLWNSGYTTE